MYPFPIRGTSWPTWSPRDVLPMRVSIQQNPSWKRQSATRASWGLPIYVLPRIPPPIFFSLSFFESPCLSVDFALSKEEACRAATGSGGRGSSGVTTASSLAMPSSRVWLGRESRTKRKENRVVAVFVLLFLVMKEHCQAFRLLRIWLPKLNVRGGTEDSAWIGIF